MKIKLSRKLRQMASALLVVMILGGILCLYVMYYLALIQQQNTLSFRSQAWNIAIAVSEAGIEEGLQALNEGRRPHVPITLDPSEWTFDGSYYWRTNGVGDNWYIVRINLGSPDVPEVIARAYVSLPAMAANTPSTFFAAAGVNTPYIVSRAVRVRCQDKSLFLAALVARHQIDLRGNSVLTDSFNSRSLWMSNFGQYDPHVYIGSRGDVASNDGVIGAIGVGNAEIYGHAHTGAEGTVTINHGWVGPYPAEAAGTYKDGWVLQDANFTFPNTDLPYDGSTGLPLGGPETIVTATYRYSHTNTTSSVYPSPAPWSGVNTNYLTTPTTTTAYPVPGTYVGSVITNYPGEGSSTVEKTYSYNYIVGTTYTYSVYQTNAVYFTNTYDHVIRNGDYYTTDDLHGSTIVLGTARLVLPNGLHMTGVDQIVIALGGKLGVFAGGTSCTVGGNGVLNLAGYAEDFILECTDTVTSFTFDGNGEFIGVLVAPNADMALNGGGHVNNDFIGAVMMNSIALNGHFSFHYDEALEDLKNNPRLLITSWDEIR